MDDDRMIYLDHASTAGWRPESVGKAMLDVIDRIAANPGRSGHRRSIEAARVVAAAREEIAGLIGAADTSKVLFTKNATEGINLVLFGLLAPNDRVLAGRFEHNAVMRPLRHLEKTRGVRIESIPGDAATPVDLAALAALLADRADPVRMVVMSSASNVTGQILPVAEVGEICRGTGAFFLVDGAQGAGILDLDVGGGAIDALALTGHKSLLGPPGVGVLWLREVDRIPPLLHGGTGSRSEFEAMPDFAPDKYEAGTANLPGIAGLAAGVRYVRGIGRSALRESLDRLLDGCCRRLRGIDGLTLYGPCDPKRQLGVISFTLGDGDVGRLAHELDRRGIACRPGLHCAPRAHRTIGTLASGGTVRFGFSASNTMEEVEQAAETLRDLR